MDSYNPRGTRKPYGKPFRGYRGRRGDRGGRGASSNNNVWKRSSSSSRGGGRASGYKSARRRLIPQQSIDPGLLPSPLPDNLVAHTPLPAFQRRMGASLSGTPNPSSQINNANTLQTSSKQLDVTSACSSLGGNNLFIAIPNPNLHYCLWTC